MGLKVNNDPMVPSWYRVGNIQREIDQVVSFDLFPTSEKQKVTGSPGQFNMLYNFTQGEIPISISGDCSQGEYVRHTVKGVGAVSTSLCNLKEGDKLGLRGPFGTTWPLQEAREKDVLIIAGGLGLAPLRPVIYHCLQNREQYKNISFLYGSRDVQNILYPDELAAWNDMDAFDVFLTIDKASKGCQWQGHVGMVTNLIAQAHFDPNNTVAMVCGPEIMMRFVSKELVGQGLQEEQVYISMERNMKCAIGHCGHCQLGSEFICKDGPVFTYKRMKKYLMVGQL